MTSQETPRPPQTAEFGYVVPGGPPHRYETVDGVDVVKFSVGNFDNNVYIVSSDGEAVIIDGADDAARIIHEVGALRVTAILQTHNHHDHTRALEALVAELDVLVYAHPEDPMPVRTEDLTGGESLGVGDGTIRVVHTPGHTPGSLCFSIETHLFSGDALFPGGPGNTDGDPVRFARSMESLDDLFGRLKDTTRVHPGHGLDTTIGRERPYLNVWRERGW